MTDQSIDWGEFDMPAEGDWPEPFKFDEEGVSIAGTITKVRVAEIDGKRMPELWIMPEDGEERSVLCGQVRLRARLAELRPASGDRIGIVFAGTEPGSKPGRTIKCFDVSHRRGDEATAAAPATASVPSADSLI